MTWSLTPPPGPPASQVPAQRSDPVAGIALALVITTWGWFVVGIVAWLALALLNLMFGWLGQGGPSQFGNTHSQVVLFHWFRTWGGLTSLPTLAASVTLIAVWHARRHRLALTGERRVRAASILAFIFILFPLTFGIFL